jgi:hypothetical protein
MAISRDRVVAAAIALAAIAIAWAFAATTLMHTPSMGLPLDDSYIYLTYAKQFGRGQPFTYFPGGGYSAGSTSVVWPMLLAPLWTLGARGHALVWASFVVCAALYACVAIGAWRFARDVGGELAGIAAATLALAIAPFAWCALSGMEVALASALLVAMLLLLARTPHTGPPSKRLALCLAALSLSRPEAMLLVFAVCIACCIQRVRTRATDPGGRGDLRAAAWWLAPLAAPLAWLVANRTLAGNLFPNTGVAKSHFYLPGFDWTYWIDAVVTQTGRMLRALFWDSASPLVWPRAFAVVYLVGAIRIARWARRERRLLVGVLAITAPLAMMLAVISSSGLWSFQNYRYIAPAFPLLAIVAGCGLGVPARIAARLRARVACTAAAGVALAGFVTSALPRLAADARLFAQGAMDTNTQVVAIGNYLHDHLPDASIMFHDAGAIAYYGDGRVYDMLGLVTNFQAGVANNGPGSRFEFLESLPPDQRPTYFAYYPAWMGTSEFYGESLYHTSLWPRFEPRRFVGDADMQVIVASWDHVGTGERPLNDHTGWGVVDRLDIADLASERAHHWHGELGRRAFGDPTARWSLVEREAGARGLVIDGGRTIRGGEERFTIAIEPSKPTRLVIRTGGQRAYPPYHEAITRPVEVKLFADDRLLGTLVLPVPSGEFAELQFALAAHALHARSVELHTVANGPYRVFHWFVLQPE